VVVQTGPGVTGWTPGDHAALEPAVYCYHCEFCRSGRHNLCAHIRFLSNNGIPGFFRGLVNLPAANLLPIPRTLPLEIATLHEPLAVALHSLEFAAVREGEQVVVFGAGPIGLLTIAGLKLSRPGRVWLVEPLAHRRAMALEMGADAALDPGQGDVAGEILRETGGRGVDCAIDCAAKEQTTNLAIRVVRNAGRVVLTGIHSGGTFAVDVSSTRRKEVPIFTVRRSNNEGHAALEMLVAETSRFAPLVTHTRPLSRIGEAFEIAAGYKDGVGKMIVKPE
jgi:L-iditol 2-dehydrogenase